MGLCCSNEENKEVEEIITAPVHQNYNTPQLSYDSVKRKRANERKVIGFKHFKDLKHIDDISHSYVCG